MTLLLKYMLATSCLNGKLKADFLCTMVVLSTCRGRYQVYARDDQEYPPLDLVDLTTPFIST